MAYTDATASDLKAAFPRFDAVADVTVEYWLTRAQRSVDDTWTEGDYAMGQMLLAAHYMVLEGLGTGTEAELASKGMAGLKSVRSGSFAFERVDGASSRNSLASTSYGERFMALARVNVGGPRVTDTGTLPTGTWPYA